MGFSMHTAVWLEADPGKLEVRRLDRSVKITAISADEETEIFIHPSLFRALREAMDLADYYRGAACQLAAGPGTGQTVAGRKP